MGVTRFYDIKNINMNKSFHIVALLLLSFMSSCVTEDIDDCVYDKQLKIDFSYLANSTENVVANYISLADLYVYEKDTKQIVQIPKYTKDQLANKDGVVINLLPGEYILVALGNKTHHTEKKNSTQPITDFYHSKLLAHPNYYLGKVVTGNDALYIAKKEVVVVDDNSDQRVSMKFHSAHVKFDVHVKGLDVEPLLEVTDLSPEINFNIQATEQEKIGYKPEFKHNVEKESFQAKFNTWRINETNKVHLEVTPEGGSLYSINLNSYLHSSLPNVQLGHEEIFIPLLIEYKDLSVLVKVPDWITKPSVPGID